MRVACCCPLHVACCCSAALRRPPAVACAAESGASPRRFGLVRTIAAEVMRLLQRSRRFCPTPSRRATRHGTRRVGPSLPLPCTVQPRRETDGIATCDLRSTQAEQTDYTRLRVSVMAFVRRDEEGGVAHCCTVGLFCSSIR